MTLPSFVVTNGFLECALLKTVTREKQLDNPSVNKKSNTNNFVDEEPNSTAPSISIEPDVTDFVHQIHGLDEDEAYNDFISHIKETDHFDRPLFCPNQ